MRRTLMREPVVTKECLEDIIEGTQADYRWWEYAFDFGDHQYRARLYTDDPTVAYVLMLSGQHARIRWWKRRSNARSSRAIPCAR